MLINRFMMLTAVAMMLAGSYFATTAVSEAHERREVLSYTFVVGFLNEPALLDEPNSLDLRVSTTADEEPVEGLEETLEVTVSAGGETMDMELSPRFNTPGAYNSHFMPTATGEYTYHITGTIDGNEIDETFTSGPGTFSSINEPVGFPNAFSAAAEEDSGGGAGTTLGIIGIVLGALGLGVGGIALMKASRTV